MIELREKFIFIQRAYPNSRSGTSDRQRKANNLIRMQPKVKIKFIRRQKTNILQSQSLNMQKKKFIAKKNKMSCELNFFNEISVINLLRSVTDMLCHFKICNFKKRTLP